MEGRYKACFCHHKSTLYYPSLGLKLTTIVTTLLKSTIIPIHKHDKPSKNFSRDIKLNSSIAHLSIFGKDYLSAPLIPRNKLLQAPAVKKKMANDVGEFVLYHYNPSTALAAVFIALFANTTLFHLWQLIRRRTWYFIPFIIGGICKFPVRVGDLGRMKLMG